MGFNYHVALSAVGNVIAFIVIAYLAVHFLKKEKMITSSFSHPYKVTQNLYKTKKR